MVVGGQAVRHHQTKKAAVPLHNEINLPEWAKGEYMSTEETQVKELAQKLLEKQTSRIAAKRTELAGRYSHALVETLEFDDNKKKFKTHIKCVGCSDQSRVVFTSDLHQVRFCSICSDQQKTQKKAQEKANFAAARAMIASGVLSTPITPSMIAPRIDLTVAHDAPTPATTSPDAATTTTGHDDGTASTTDGTDGGNAAQDGATPDAAPVTPPAIGWESVETSTEETPVPETPKKKRGRPAKAKK